MNLDAAKVTQAAERSNVGGRRLNAFTRRMQQVRPGEGREEQDSVSQRSPLSMSSEIQLFARLLCGPERRRERAGKR